MKIYGLCLSNNPNSINRAFLNALMEEKGGEVISFAETDFPLFKAGDALPANLPALCKKLQESDAIVVSTPEYNGTFSPFGKNVLDWISTQGTFNGFEKETPLSGKSVLLCAVAPGPLGGIRSIPSVSTVLGELGCVVTKTFATTGGYNSETYNYKNAFSIMDLFLELAK